MDTMEILSEWRTWLDASYAPSTSEGYFGAAWRFLGAAGVSIVDVRESQIAIWIESFPYRSSCRVTYFHGLRSLFSFALRRGYVDRDPTAGIRVPTVEEKEPRALTVEQYEAVRDAAYRHSDVRGLAVELLYYTGGRIGETLKLTWDNVVEDGVIFAGTKGGKERKVPWSPGLRRAVDGLRSHFGEQDRVLPRADQTIWSWVRDAGSDAGVDRVHPHLLRATTATRLQERGAMPTVAQRLLGHRKLTTTQRYFAPEQGAVADAVQLL